MSSPAEQPERQGTSPEMPSEVGPQKTYAFIYAPGPQWLAGRSVTEQNLGAIAPPTLITVLNVN
jgi:hypothetical protein